MKFYKNKGTDEISHVLLESIEDVNLYIENKDIFWKQSIEDFNFCNNESIESRSRILTHSKSKNTVVALAKTHATFFNFKVPVSANVVNDFYNKQLVKIFKLKNNLFVNKVGGYCFKEAFDMDEYEMVFEIELKDFLSSDNYSLEYFNSSVKFLVLENDPIIDKYTINFICGEIFPYLCNLREAMASGLLLEVCKKFKKYEHEKNSSKILIYTTGYNFEQILKYVNIISESNIKKISWIFKEKLPKEKEDILVKLLKEKEIEYFLMEEEEVNEVKRTLLKMESDFAESGSKELSTAAKDYIVRELMYYNYDFTLIPFLKNYNFIKLIKKEIL